MRDTVSVLRQKWLPIRQRLIPYDSRRDWAYRLLRYYVWRSQKFVRPDPSLYERFQQTFEPSRSDLAVQRTDARLWSDPPVFSIVTAVFQPSPAIFRQTLRSIRRQTYSHWRWHVVDASPEDTVWRYLKWAAVLDSRIQPVRLRANEGMALNINHALRAATGDFVVMLDHDDTLAPFALHALARAIRTQPHVDFLYSDCDKLDEKGRRCDPFFKPDWSPELLMATNYLEHVAVFRRALLDLVGGIDPAFGGAYDWDLYLRISEHTRSFAHVPQVLYHWRKTPGSTAQDIQNKPFVRKDQQKAVLAHLYRRGLIEPRVEFDDGIGIRPHGLTLTWKSPAEPRVSIVLPTRDHADFLSVCLRGILQQTTYRNLEVVLVDTGSIEGATRRLYDTLAGQPNVRMVELLEPFNFSKACNVGVQHADGDLVLLLNNDIEILNADWLSRMVQWFEIPGVGIVGPKLLYPDGTMHHSGVVVGTGGLASMLFVHCPAHLESIFGPDGWYRNLSAVSGACLLTTRTLYEELGGLDERFLLNYSDVDFCVRATERGYRVVVTPDARLVHYDGATHGHRIPRSDFLEATRSFQRLLQTGDPFFNPNLSCSGSPPTFRRNWRDNPMDANRDLLMRLPNKEIIKLPDDLEETGERA